jgi:branched-subunit amino acid ABC-type transport system permease component
MIFIDLVQSIVDGLLFGATYALIGIGFTLVFGVMHKINMAYAAASVGGAYAALRIISLIAGPAWASLLVAAVVGGLFGLLIYWLCFRFIPLSNQLATLMSTVGMFLLVEEIIVHSTDGMPQNYPVVVRGILNVGEFMIRGDLVFVFVCALLAMVVLLYLLYRTKLGMATRAVSQQPIAAQLVGIRLDHINALTFIVTGMLGGFAGALIGSAVGLLSPLLVVPLTVKGLIVTVIGGLGNIPGAIIAGLMVGMAENVFQYFRGVTERDIYVLLLLFVFLVFRPGGIFSNTAKRG